MCLRTGCIPDAHAWHILCIAPASQNRKYRIFYRGRVTKGDILWRTSDPEGRWENHPSVFRVNIFISSTLSWSPRRVARSARVYSGFRTRELFSPRIRTPSSSSFLDIAVTRYRGIHHLDSTSSLLNEPTVKRWSISSMRGIPSIESIVRMSVWLASIDSNFWRPYDRILEKLNTKRVVTIAFAMIAFSHVRIARNASFESSVYVSTTVRIIEARRSRNPLNIWERVEDSRTSRILDTRMEVSVRFCILREVIGKLREVPG